MADEVLVEEFEVLQSIYPEELSQISDRVIQINVEPEGADDSNEKLSLTLEVSYPEGYPDELPKMSFIPMEGELDDQEQSDLMKGLHSVGEENIGMAMTFTLVSHLREQLADLVRTREEERIRRELEEERRLIEEEEMRTRGTPVTLESFKAWKVKFDAEMAAKKAKEDEEKIKALTPKEREEWRKIGSRLSGRQLFERNKNLEDESLVEEDSVSVDVSQYERIRGAEMEEDEEHVTFSDSD